MKFQRYFVIGGAGFIGSHLVERLVEKGPVTIYDNLTVGKPEMVQSHLDSGAATLVEGELLELDDLAAAMKGHDVVFHLAANPEARWGLENPRLDLEQGTIGTWNALEAARRTECPKIVFSSSGTVYGECASFCAEGDLGQLPISLYGASKLAGEAMISAYAECFGLQAWIYRFGNVVGPRMTHGAAVDFMKKLQKNPDELEVLGDGSQAKPYVYVSDCVDAILFGLERATDRVNVFNIAPSDYASVRFIAEQCIAQSPHKHATIRYTGGDRGWPGDVPQSRLDSSKLNELGWESTHNSEQAVKDAVAALASEVFGQS